MTSRIHFPDRERSRSIARLVSMAIPAHQLRAAIDPTCPAAILEEAGESSGPDMAKRVDELVEACALTGCPPCIRRASLRRGGDRII